VRSARAAPADRRRARTARTRLAEVLGRKVTLDIETDPELIAGLELDAPHAIVRNHFRADLDRIKAEVLAHD
jgi:F-type H+-transporting ATPase subunit b